MWNAVPIVKDIYGFQLEQNNDDVWVSTAVIKENRKKMTIYADVHMTYLEDKEKYDKLLAAIRSFSKYQKSTREKEQCMIKFHCLGICLFEDQDECPHVTSEHEYKMIDEQFEEEIGA